MPFHSACFHGHLALAKSAAQQTCDVIGFSLMARESFWGFTLCASSQMIKQPDVEVVRVTLSRTLGIFCVS